MIVSNVSGVALMTSSLFLLVVAVSLNSPHLFYMSTAMIATLVAARVQAYLAIRHLKIKRKAPREIQSGQWAQVDLTVETHQKFKRPLITLWDHLPPRLVNDTISPSTPVAPAADGPVVSSYRFRPTMRGQYRWSKVSVVGSDALGLVSMVREYSTDESAELLVLPQPIAVPFDAVSAAGWGNSEAEHGLSRGSGIDPRGTREYVYGDSMRYVHWRSTARTGKLVVKEFETGSNAAIAFFVQTGVDTEVGIGGRTSLELMCGHLAHISMRALRQGIRIQFPSFEADAGSISPAEREVEILRMLATLSADGPSLAQDVMRWTHNLLPGATVFLFLAVADPDLPSAIREIRRKGSSAVCQLYDADSIYSKGRFKGQSAADPGYMDELREAGALTRIMPLEGLETLE